MADERLVAALLQQELDAAQRPYFGNPNLARQGQRANIAERSKAFPFMEAANAQFEKEKSSLSDRGAVTDLINKGFIAGLGGAPVDIINMGLTPLGMGSAFPFGGSEHIKRAMEDYGVATPTERPIFEGIASLTPPRAVMGVARVAGQGAEALGRAAAPVAGQALENYMVKSGGILPMDTWHGSPHRFPPTAKNPLGEFDPTKIGTGEGAQAYGAGAGYLAEAKGTGIGYRDQLTIDPRNSVNEVRGALSNSVRVSYWGQGENIPRLDDISLEMKRHQTLSPYFNDNTFKKDILKIIQGTDRNGVVTDEVINILRRLDKTMPKPSGYLYKVDLADEQIPKMLDWDKPFDKQHPEVQQALVNIANAEEKGSKMLKLMQDGNPSGKDIFRSLLTEPQLIDSPSGWISVDNKKEISKLLQTEGIPGIRYLDQGSRAGGAGTSNFVVFDPAHMNIIGRE